MRAGRVRSCANAPEDANPLAAGQAFLTDPPVVDKILKNVELKAPGSQRGPPPDDQEQRLAS